MQGTLSGAFQNLRAPGPCDGLRTTDAGVHALRYCANFRSASLYPLGPLTAGCELPAAGGHRPSGAPARSRRTSTPSPPASERNMCTRIMSSRIRDPFLKTASAFLPVPPGHRVHESGARAFEGTHDILAAVRSLGSETKTTVAYGLLVPCRREGEHIEIMRVCRRLSLQHGARHGGDHGLCRPWKAAAGGDTALLERGDRRLTGPTYARRRVLYMNRVWYEGPPAP